MKLFYILSLFISASVFAANNNAWQDLRTGERYKLNQEIAFEGAKFKINKGTKLKLIESTPLNMIKVHLQRYKVSGCSENNLETDLELVAVKGNNKAAVGLNMSKGCILEVFVEKKDLNKESLLL